MLAFSSPLCCGRLSRRQAYTPIRSRDNSLPNLARPMRTQHRHRVDPVLLLLGGYRPRR